MVKGWLWRSWSIFVRRPFQFFCLLVEVGVEVAFDKACMRFLELVFVKVSENHSNIIQQLVDPGKMKQRLVDGLQNGPVSQGIFQTS